MEKQAFKRIPVSSSNIASIGHSFPRRMLEVEFKDGSVYRYRGVNRKMFKEMLGSESKGKYLHQKIKGVYPYRKHIDRDGDKTDDKYKMSKVASTAWDRHSPYSLEYFGHLEDKYSKKPAKELAKSIFLAREHQKTGGDSKKVLPMMSELSRKLGGKDPEDYIDTISKLYGLKKTKALKAIEPGASKAVNVPWKKIGGGALAVAGLTAAGVATKSIYDKRKAKNKEEDKVDTEKIAKQKEDITEKEYPFGDRLGKGYIVQKSLRGARNGAVLLGLSGALYGGPLATEGVYTTGPGRPSLGAQIATRAGKGALVGGSIGAGIGAIGGSIASGIGAAKDRNLSYLPKEVQQDFVKREKSIGEEYNRIMAPGSGATDGEKALVAKKLDNILAEHKGLIAKGKAIRLAAKKEKRASDMLDMMVKEAASGKEIIVSPRIYADYKEVPSFKADVANTARRYGRVAKFHAKRHPLAATALTAGGVLGGLYGAEKLVEHHNERKEKERKEKEKIANTRGFDEFIKIARAKKTNSGFKFGIRYEHGNPKLVYDEIVPGSLLINKKEKEVGSKKEFAQEPRLTKGEKYAYGTLAALSALSAAGIAVDKARKKYNLNKKKKEVEANPPQWLKKEAGVKDNIIALSGSKIRQAKKKINKIEGFIADEYKMKAKGKGSDTNISSFMDDIRKQVDNKNAARRETLKAYSVAAPVLAGAALLAAGGTKMYKNHKKKKQEEDREA